MNNESIPVEDQLPRIEIPIHADDLRQFVSNVVIPRLNFFTDRWNGVEVPKLDVVDQYAQANSLTHLPRAVQEAAYNAANPNSPIVTAAMDPVTAYAAANGMAHLPRPVQEAAFAASGATIPRVPEVQA